MRMLFPTFHNYAYLQSQNMPFLVACLRSITSLPNVSLFYTTSLNLSLAIFIFYAYLQNVSDYGNLPITPLFGLLP